MATPIPKLIPNHYRTPLTELGSKPKKAKEILGVVSELNPKFGCRNSRPKLTGEIELLPLPRPTVSQAPSHGTPLDTRRNGATWWPCPWDGEHSGRWAFPLLQSPVVALAQFNRYQSSSFPFSTLNLRYFNAWRFIVKNLLTNLPTPPHQLSDWIQRWSNSRWDR